MIAKIIKGTGFRGVLNYLLRGNRGTIIGGNMAGVRARELAHEFAQFRKLRPALGKAVAHIPISLHPDDRTLTGGELAEIAQRIAEGLGFANCARVIVSHNDTQHQHFHMLLSRIDCNGKPVSDAHDYRKAEQLLRQIECEYHLHQVLAPGASPKPKKTKPKEEPMNQPQTTPRPSPPAIDPLAMVMSDPSSRLSTPAHQKRKREQKRELTEPNYEQWIRDLFGDELRNIYHHTGGTVLYFDKPKELRDEGHKVTARNMDAREAAEKMVAMAAARGWTVVTFTGPEVFVRAAMRQAMDRGIKVAPIDDLQIGLLDVIRTEILADSLVAGNTPEPESFLARLRKRRNDQASAPAPAPAHAPLRPRF